MQLLLKIEKTEKRCNKNLKLTQCKKTKLKCKARILNFDLITKFSQTVH